MIQDDDGTVSRLDEDFNPFDGIQSSISELQAQVDGIEGSISSKIDKIQSQIPTVDDILAQIVIPKPVCNCSCNCQSNSIHDLQDTEEAIAGNKPALPKNGGKPRG